MPPVDKNKFNWAKWGMIAAGLIFLLIALYVITLAYPQLFIRNHEDAGMVRLYYGNADKTAIAELASRVEWRIQNSGFYDSSLHYNAFYFEKPGNYKFYAFLARVPNPSQGFALSIFGNAFVNAGRIHELGELHNHQPPYSIYEGDPVHILTHEIAHLIISDQIGRSTWKALPHWKQEGLPEYIANSARAKLVDSISLENRIDILQNDFYWDVEYGWDRKHYKSGLMIEYLLDIKGLLLEEIIADSTEHDQVFSEMIEWRRSMP